MCLGITGAAAIENRFYIRRRVVVEGGQCLSIQKLVVRGLRKVCT